MAMLSLACICITILPYRVACRAGAWILGGETGICPEQMDPFAVKQARIVLPNKVLRLPTGKTCELYSIYLQHALHIEDFKVIFRISTAVSWSRQNGGTWLLSPMRDHCRDTALYFPEEGLASVMRQGNITQVTFGLFFFWLFWSILGKTKGSQAKVFCCTLFSVPPPPCPRPYLTSQFLLLIPVTAVGSRKEFIQFSEFPILPP